MDRLFRCLVKKGTWLLVAKIFLSIFVLVYAATITISSTNYEAEVGSTLNVANGLLATDKGFTPTASAIGASGTSCSSPVVFGPSPGIASTGVSIGHLYYDVQVNYTSAPASQKFNVTLVLSGTTYGPLCIQDLGVPVTGQTIDCKFDVGTSLPSSPYSFKVTIQ